MDHPLSIRIERFSIALITGAMALSAAQAQVLEEVIVTAQKREQSIQDVGISITAFSGEQLEQLGFTSTNELGSQTPGLLVTDISGGVTTVFTVRGSAQLDFGDMQEPPVAIYTDGAYNSYIGGVGFKFYDMERIEVLRGPQGTLFGRNATGGLVHVINKKPTREFEAFGEATAGENGLWRFEGAVSGPLTETLAARASVFVDDNDGYVENRNGDDFNDTHHKNARLQFLFEPTENFSALVGVRAGFDHNNSSSYNIEPAVTDFPVLQFTGVGITGLPGDGLVKFVTPAQHQEFCTGQLGFPPAALGSTDCSGYFDDDDRYSNATNDPGFFKRTHLGMTATFEWALSENLEITNIVDWQDFKKRYREESDMSPNELFSFMQFVDSTQISEEFRLQGDYTPFRWVLGAYFLNIDSDYRSTTEVLPCCLFNFDNDFSLETTTYAFFAQGEYDINEQWTAIVGLRWTEDEKDFELTPECTDISVPLIGFSLCTDIFGPGLFNFVQAGPPVADSRSENDWSGVAEVNWKPNEDWLVYAKVSRGIKAGSYNGGAAVLLTIDQLDFNGETLVAYEGGFKSTLFGGIARLNASVYHYDYKDFQTFTAMGPSLIVFNIDAENTGGEVELMANPWEGWDFMFGMAFQDAKQKDLTYAVSGVTKDRAMPNAPDFTFNGLGRYQWPAFGGAAAVQMDFNYVDKRSLNAIDHPALQDGSYWLANAKASWASGDGHWNFELWVRNLTDEFYIPTAFDISTFTGVVQQVQPPPRWFGGAIRYTF